MAISGKSHMDGEPGDVAAQGETSWLTWMLDVLPCPQDKVVLTAALPASKAGAVEGPWRAAVHWSVADDVEPGKHVIRAR